MFSMLHLQGHQSKWSDKEEASRHSHIVIIAKILLPKPDIPLFDFEKNSDSHSNHHHEDGSRTSFVFVRYLVLVVLITHHHVSAFASPKQPLSQNAMEKSINKVDRSDDITE
jgi:hypothetical protein